MRMMPPRLFLLILCLLAASVIVIADEFEGDSILVHDTENSIIPTETPNAITDEPIQMSEPIKLVPVEDEHQTNVEDIQLMLVEPPVYIIIHTPSSPSTPLIRELVIELSLVVFAILTTWRSLAILGDASFDSEFYLRGVYSVRWLLESLGTLMLALYFSGLAISSLFDMQGLSAITALSSSIFFVSYYCCIAIILIIYTRDMWVTV